jgi:hypothetical protein
VQPNKLKQVVATIFAAEPEELLCSEFFRQLAGYVEQEIAGNNAARLMPGIALHLHQCPECADTHAALLHAARQHT